MHMLLEQAKQTIRDWSSDEPRELEEAEEEMANLAAEFLLGSEL